MTDKQELAVVDAEHCIDFDVILTYLGEFGCYQKRLLVYMIPVAFSMGFIYLTQIFLIIVPDHWCYVPEVAHLPKEEQLNLAIPKNSDNDFHKCDMYDTNYTYVLEAKIAEANESWPQKPCQKWVYDKKQLPYDSIATEFNWVCQNALMGPGSISGFFVGSIVGGIIFGYTSDHWGRIPTVMLSNLFGLVGGILSSLCKSFWGFLVTRFIVGMAFDTCYNSYLILVLEYVGSKYRTFVTNIPIAIFFTTCVSILPWIAYLCNSWRLLSLVSVIPTFISIVTFFFISESARWLLTVDKIDKSIKRIKGVAKTNGKSIPEDVMDYFQKCSAFKYNLKHLSKAYTVLDLFKSCLSFRIISILCIVWMITAVVYDAHVRAIIEIGPDIFYTFSIACLVELPAGLIPVFVMHKTGRIILCLIGFIGCAIGSFLSALLQARWQIAVAASVGRFFSTINYNIGLQWAAEILPTVVRGQGLAFIHVMGLAASFLSPLIVHTGTFLIQMPMIIIGILSIIGAIFVCFLPETNGCTLPQTLDDAKKMWKQNTGCFRTKRRNNQ